MRLRIAILAACALCGITIALRAQPTDGIKAVVNNGVITLEEVERYADQANEVLMRQYSRQPELYQQKLMETRKEGLEYLMERQLILHDFDTAGYKIPESIIDEEVQRRIQSMYSDRATLTKSLQAEGMTYEKYRQQVRDTIIIEAMREKNISHGIIISPHKIENYYLDHKEDFKLEDQVKVRMIVLSKSASDDKQARQMIEEIRAKIREGATFAEMASVYSQGAQRSQGGARDWEDLSGMKKELAGAVAGLQPGQTSDVIETPEACYLMLLEDKRLAHVKPLADVRDEIETTLLKVEHNRLQEQWIDRLKKKTFIRYF